VLVLAAGAGGGTWWWMQMASRARADVRAAYDASDCARVIQLASGSTDSEVSALAETCQRYTPLMAAADTSAGDATAAAGQPPDEQSRLWMKAESGYQAALAAKPNDRMAQEGLRKVNDALTAIPPPPMKRDDLAGPKPAPKLPSQKPEARPQSQTPTPEPSPAPGTPPRRPGSQPTDESSPPTAR
jgi:hypothetical protein